MSEFFASLSVQFWFVIIVIAILALAVGILIGTLLFRIRALGENKAIRQDALKRARSVIL